MNTTKTPPASNRREHHMTRNRKRWTTAGAVAALAIAGSALAAGCSNQLNDLGGVQQASPDYALTYVNVSDFPNITLVCIRGVAFATTTRTGVDVLRVSEWDSFCATKEPANGAPKPAPSTTASP